MIDSAMGGFRPERIFDCDIDYFGDCTALRSTSYSAKNELPILYEGVEK